MANRLKWWRRFKENALLDPEERAALARDIGVSESTFAELVARGKKAGDELSRLMQALSLDSEQVNRGHGPELRDMQVICTLCHERRRCRRNLRNGTASSNYAQYCPNALSLGELTRSAQA